MSMNVSVDDKGSIKRCRDALGRYSENISGADPEIEMQLQRAWNKVKMDAVLMCPKDTGTLAGTIRVVRSEEVDGISSVNKSITMFDRAILAGDLMKINPKSHEPCNYAQIVHDGYMRKDGAIYIGVPFLTYALALNEGTIQDALDKALINLGTKFSEGGS
jgi:hypothetical protein